MEKPNKKEKTDQNKKLLVLTQELKLARILAGNNKSSRDKALKSLTKWLKQRCETMPYSEEDFLRLWKGLFYSMWQSDKPLIQEECAENTSKLIHNLPLKTALLFFKAGMQTLINEWFGIDQLRLDKFLMFTRRLLRQTLIVLKDDKFKKASIDIFGEYVSSTILNIDKKPPLGLFMHFTEIYLEELAKIGGENLSAPRVLDFLRPFITRLAGSNDGREIGQIRKFIFTYLIRQSDLGLEYQEKYNAWKREGFPGTINSMQKVSAEDMEVDDEETEEMEQDEQEDVVKVLDPRAGRVDVELPQLKFHAKEVANALLAVKFDKQSNKKTRQMVSVLAEQFEKLGKGKYPLGVKQIDLPKKEECDTSVRKAVNRLVKFEKKLMGSSNKKDKKKRKRELENGVDKVEEELGTKKKKSKMVIEENDDVHLVDEEIPKAVKQKKKKIKKDTKGLKSELEEFIRKSEASPILPKPKRKIRNKKQPDFFGKPYDNTPEFTFERNSGTWIVHREVDASPTRGSPKPSNFSNGNDLGNFLAVQLEKGASPKKTISPSKEDGGSPSQKRAGKISPSKSSPAKVEVKVTVEKENKKPLSDTKKKSPSPSSSSKKEQKASPVNGDVKASKKLFQSPSNEKKANLFQTSEWEEPLRDGEYEIVVPSKKFVNKMKTEAKKTNQSVQQLINDNLPQTNGTRRNSSVHLNNILPKIKGKNRCSLDSRIAKVPSTPGSAKKVKIDTRLNQSQEVHEHLAQLVSSPAIPFDASKKPSKTVLKRTGSTPINPFYKRPRKF